jgi:subtilase family serine protease
MSVEPTQVIGVRGVSGVILGVVAILALAGVTAPAAAQPPRPDLAVVAVSKPPATAAPGHSFDVTDTVENRSATAAGPSTTRYYLSFDPVRTLGDKLLTGSRGVPGLAPREASTGTASVTIPLNTLAGIFFLLACADDRSVVTESHETNNCRASTTPIEVARPDLVVTAVSDPPRIAAPGDSFAVTDTVENRGRSTAGASTTRFYLSIDPVRSGADKPLAGILAVPGLEPRRSSTGTVTVTIPSEIAPGKYFLLVCADDARAVPEGNEANNCLASSKLLIVGAIDRRREPRQTRGPGQTLKDGGGAGRRSAL